MSKYRKKPVVIDAMVWDGKPSTFDTVLSWCAAQDRTFSISGGCLYIDTLEGEMRADKGDWIIKGVQGELYPCKPDIFAATYEKVED
jgi:hypothetical protein